MPRVCYRHPTHKAGVTCQRCDKPICPSCMVTASVGFHCPECAGLKREGLIPSGGPPATTGGSGVKRGQRTARPWRKYSQELTYDFVERGAPTKAFIPFTVAVLLVNLVLFGFAVYYWGSLLPSELGRIEINYGLATYFLQEGEWWRIFTSGFTHGGILHIGFNMLLMWVLGRELEIQFGPYKFSLLYLTSLVGGSFGALLLSGPNDLTIGASGAVYGLMGAYVVLNRFVGRRITDSPIAFLLFINIVGTFFFRGVSIGGHFGGLATGLLLGYCYSYLPRSLSSYSRSGKLPSLIMYASSILVGSALFVGCLIVANNSTLT